MKFVRVVKASQTIRSVRNASYRIAAENQPKFARAFNDAVRNALDDETLVEMEKLLGAGDVNAAVNIILEDATWKKLEEKLARAYDSTIDDAVSGELKKLPSAVKKAKKKETPIPFGDDWIKERSAALVANITQTQRTMLRDIISQNFREGKKPADISRAVRKVVGLLPRDLNAVENRRELHLDAGMSAARADKLADAYANELRDRRADVIAVTETTAAEAQGKREAWSFAQDKGMIPSKARRVWVTSNAPCPECKRMSGKKAEIGGLYPGGVEGPPLHPRCFCSEGLA